MRAALAILLVLVTAFPSMAINRYQSTSLSCSEIKDRIANQGAVILRYPGRMNPSLTVYDRFVVNRSQCSSHEVAERLGIPAADTRSCKVSRCVPAPDRCDEPGAFCNKMRMPKMK